MYFAVNFEFLMRIFRKPPWKQTWISFFWQLNRSRAFAWLSSWSAIDKPRIRVRIMFLHPLPIALWALWTLISRFKRNYAANGHGCISSRYRINTTAILQRVFLNDDRVGSDKHLNHVFGTTFVCASGNCSSIFTIQVKPRCRQA